MDDEEAHLQDDPYDDIKSVEESVRHRLIMEAGGRGIYCLGTNKGGKTHANKTGMIFFKLENQTESSGTMNSIGQKSSQY